MGDSDDVLLERLYVLQRACFVTVDEYGRPLVSVGEEYSRCLLKLGQHGRERAFEHLLSLQHEVVKLAEAPYCRGLVVSLMFLMDREACERAAQRMLSVLDVRLKEARVIRGNVALLLIPKLGIFCSDYEASRVIVNGMALHSLVPRTWLSAVQGFVDGFALQCITWMHFPIDTFPVSYWTSAFNGNRVLKSDLLLTLVLCLNPNFAREVIRRGLLQRLLDQVGLEEKHNRYNRRGCMPRTPTEEDFESAQIERILCPIARLEIPEFSSHLKLAFMRLVAQVVARTSEFTSLLRACLLNPGIREVLKANGFKSSFTLASLRAYLSANMEVSSGLIGLLKNESKEPSNNAVVDGTMDPEELRRDGTDVSDAGTYLDMMRESLSASLRSPNIFLPDSLLRRLATARSKDGSTLLHMMAGSIWHIWWYGLSVRFITDWNSRDEEQRTPILTSSIDAISRGSIPIALFYHSRVDLCAKDRHGHGLIDMLCGPHGTGQTVGKLYVSIDLTTYLASKGVFATEDHVAHLYASTNWLDSRDYLRKLALAVWRSPTRLPKTYADLVRHFIAIPAYSAQTPVRVHYGFARSLLVAELLCELVAMRAIKSKSQCSVHRLPNDLHMKLFRDHFTLPWTEQDRKLKLDEKTGVIL